MSKSRFVFDKFAKFLEEGLVNYKDFSDEVVNILRSKKEEIILKMNLVSKDEIDILNNEDDLDNVKDKIFSNLFIVEPLVGNRELTVSIFENKPLVVTEIISKKNFFYDKRKKIKDSKEIHILENRNFFYL